MRYHFWMQACLSLAERGLGRGRHRVEGNVTNAGGMGRLIANRVLDPAAAFAQEHVVPGHSDTGAVVLGPRDGCAATFNLPAAGIRTALAASISASEDSAPLIQRSRLLGDPCLSDPCLACGVFRNPPAPAPSASSP